jgi:hypothetical protein
VTRQGQSDARQGHVAIVSHRAATRSESFKLLFWKKIARRELSDRVVYVKKE